LNPARAAGRIIAAIIMAAAIIGAMVDSVYWLPWGFAFAALFWNVSPD